MISVTVSGVDEAIRVALKARELLLLYALQECESFGESCVRRMKWYHPPGGPHPPPGEQPVYGKHRYIDRTGELTGGIGFKVTPWSGNKALVAVFSIAPYSREVEEGTPHSRPYPFFWPTFYTFLPILIVGLATAADRAFQDAASMVV